MGKPQNKIKLKITAWQKEYEREIKNFFLGDNRNL
jgi:hypothetical protein